MDAYPPPYVEHNLPLVLLSGLGGHVESQHETLAGRQEHGVKIHLESPTCLDEKTQLLRQEFEAYDGTASRWNVTSLPGPTGTLRYRMRNIGRVMQHRKAYLVQR